MSSIRTSSGSLPPASTGPTKPGAAARKSQAFNDSRTARKASQTTARSSGGSTSDTENGPGAGARKQSESVPPLAPAPLKRRARDDTSATSSSTKAHKQEERDSAPLRTRTEDADDATSVTTTTSAAAPAGRGKGKGKDAGVLNAVNARAGTKPSSVASVQFGGGGKGKVNLRSLQNRQSTITGSASELDREESPNVKSVSSNGYNWEVERLGLKPEDVKSRLSYHKSITTTIDREGIVETVRFRRGDKIWILPDPHWLPEDGQGMDITDLPEDEYWCATILDACALDQRSQGEESLGLLRIQWMYAPEHVDTLKTLHKDYKKWVKQYRFDDGEFVDSDHIDFIGIETFAGFADGVETFLRITGLTVEDEERLKPEHKRKKPRANLYTRMTGFKLKAQARQQAEAKVRREAREKGIVPTNNSMATRSVR